MEAGQGTSLELICARQWAACVDRAAEGLGAIDPRRVHTLRYESLAADPLAGLSGILAFLGAEVQPEALTAAARGFHGGSIGKGKRAGSVHTQAMAAMADTLLKHGYET